MKVFIADAGELGTALAIILAKAGNEVTLLIQNFDYPHLKMFLCLSRIGKNEFGKRENNLHLPGVELPQNVRLADSFEAASDADVVLLAVPSKFLWNAVDKLKPVLEKNPKCALALFTKGVDAFGKIPHGLKLRNNLNLTLGHMRFAVISGFTPAKELAISDLTMKYFAASAASYDLNTIKKIKKLFRGTRLGITGTKDIIGVSMGGALKNAYAIGYGIMLKAGGNKDAWNYLERALFEIKIFLDNAGARIKTLESPAVKADFYLTSMGELGWESRNVAFGKFLAERRSPEEIKEYLSRHTVEGHESMMVLWQIAHEKELDAPLLYRIHAICELEASPDTLFPVN